MGRILAGSRAEQGTALVWVQDHGVGIPSEFLEEVFFPIVVSTPELPLHQRHRSRTLYLAPNHPNARRPHFRRKLPRPRFPLLLTIPL